MRAHPRQMEGMSVLAKVQKEPGTGLFPLPVVMASCAIPGARPNLITLAWVGVVASEPPVIAIGVRPERYSHALIIQSGEFVINIPDQNILAAVDYCGMVSGNEVDKFRETGLTPSEGRTVRTPHVAEAPVCLECQVRQVVPLGSHDLILGEVTAVLAEGAIMTEGRIDLARVLPVAYGNGRYWAIGPQLEVYGFSKAKR